MQQVILLAIDVDWHRRRIELQVVLIVSKAAKY